MTPPSAGFFVLEFMSASVRKRPVKKCNFATID